MSSWRGEDSSGPTKQSWKKAKSKAATAGGKYWSTGSAKRPLISSNLVRLFLALTVLLAATGILVLYLARQDLPTPIISIAAIEYPHPWAPNAWASEDQRRLETLGGSSKFTVSAKQEKKHGSWQELVDLQLQQVKPGGPGGSLLPILFGYRSLVVHLSAHGVLNGQGEPCLLFSDADPLDDRTWVPLTDVLRSVGEHATVQQTGVKVLLVLDTGKQPPDFRLGLLSPGFVEEACAQIESLPYSDFAVLMACDQDQYAWSAPEMGGSVFGFMVAVGLQGLADELSGDGDRRVSVQELETFVASAVDGYVREHRGRVQNPRIVWSGGNQSSDFELCYASDYSAAAGAAYSSDARVQKISDAWKSVSSWSKSAPSHASWQRAVAIASVARAEQLLWSGAAYRDQFDEEIERAQRAIETPSPRPWPDSICSASLAWLNQFHPPGEILRLGNGSSASSGSNSGSPPEDPGDEGADSTAATTGSSTDNSDTTAASAAETDGKAPRANPAEQVVEWLTFDGQLDEGQKAPERPKRPDRRVAVQFLYEWFLSHPDYINATVMNRAVEWLGAIGEAHTVTREEALLRAIHNHLQLTDGWSLDAQRSLGLLWSQYLKTAWECELAVATAETRATSTLERLSTRVLSELQATRDLIHGCQTQRDASDCAVALKQVGDAVAKLLAARERLERAWRLRDHLAFELPVLAQWIASPLSRLQPLEPSLAWTKSGELIQRLASINAELLSGDIPEASDLDAAEQQLRELTAGHSQSLHEVMNVSAAGQRQALSNLALSLGIRPGVLAGVKLSERARLHRDLDGRYQDLSGTSSKEKLAAYCNSSVTEGVDTDPIWRQQDLPTDFAGSFAPLHFASKSLAVAVGPAPVKSDRSRLAAAGAELRNAWNGLPEELSQRCQSAVEMFDSNERPKLAEAEQKLLAGEYQSHWVAQLVPADRLDASPAPEALTQLVCKQKFALWQASRALNDFWRTPLLPQSQNHEFMLGGSAAWQAVAARVPRGPVEIAARRHQAVAALMHRWPDTLSGLQFRNTGSVTQWAAELSLRQFPTGGAWIRLALGGNPAEANPLTSGGGQRLQVPIGTGERARNQERFTASAVGLREGNHELLAWFRGHEAVAPVPIYNAEPPLTLAWKVEAPTDTTVRVEAEPKPTRIVFVLDCSGSMRANLETAKRTLLGVVRELPAERTEIAVVLFGHSVTYKSRAEDSPSQWRADHPSSPVHRPYDDVEMVQPLTQLSPQVVNELETLLADLRPHGGTPLYEAILQSVESLDRQDGFNGDRRILVITDGNNSVHAYADRAQTKVLTGGLLTVPDEYIHSEQSVSEQVQGRATIDLVLFNFTDARNQLQSLASSTDGRLYDADNNTLAEELRNSIARDTFTTKNLASGRNIGSKVRLALAQHVDPDQLPGRFEVEIDHSSHRKTVSLIGGEAIEMQYRRKVGLSFLPYDEGDAHPLQGAFTQLGNPYAAIMLTGVPRNLAQIRVCLQSQDASIQSLRPERFLLEVRRIRAGQPGGQPIAWTSDAQWEARHRSPVLRLPIKNLPKLGDDRLEARLWLADPSVAAQSQRNPLALFREQAVQVAEGVSAVAETQLEAGGLRVTLTESRDERSPLVHWTVTPAPDTLIEHRFHDGKVVHEFFYADPTMQSQIELATLILPAAPNEQWEATEWIRVPRW